MSPFLSASQSHRVVILKAVPGINSPLSLSAIKPIGFRNPSTGPRAIRTPPRFKFIYICKQGRFALFVTLICGVCGDQKSRTQSPLIALPARRHV